MEKGIAASRLSPQEIDLAILAMYQLASFAEAFREGELSDSDWRELNELIDDAKHLYRAARGQSQQEAQTR